MVRARVTVSMRVSVRARVRGKGKSKGNVTRDFIGNAVTGAVAVL